MRLLILLVFVFFITTAAQAQMDERFYFPVKEWKSLDGVLYEEVTLPHDSVSLSAIFLKPAGKPKGTILFLHGAGGNVTSYVFITKPLVEHGYQVFMIDFRGYGKSTGKPTHTSVAADGEFVFNYLVNRPDVKGTELLLFGTSLGTQIAAHLARNHSTQVNGLVLEGGMSSLTDIALAYAPAEHHAMIRQIPMPYAAKEDVKFLKTVPVLVVHSREDKEVPFAQGEVLYNNAAGRKNLLVYSGGHLEGMKANTQEYLTRIDALLK
jgi:dipeptidyl aminopeptidase/acylaminoacyl peptidase